MQRWIRQYATVGLAASALAAQALYGANWHQDPRWRILHYGIDLAAFPNAIGDAADIRAELGLGTDTFVIGNVGRFDAQKNHAFLVDVAAVVMATAPEARLLLVGDGGLRSDVERKARSLGIADKIVMTGVRQDVARVMTGAMDCFALPSRYEGLPLVLLEAQAAGLPCIVADTVSEEADVIPELVSRLSLAQPVQHWAEAVLEARGRRLPLSSALSRLENSSFSIGASAAQLLQVYSA
jgi:glycosyltransferase involved in cell wall biosynthesis